MDLLMCRYFHPKITSKLWRTRSATGNHWIHCFTSQVFFLISWILRHRMIVPFNNNTENTLQHPGHMHFHVPINVQTNTVRREGRINALQSYIYCRIMESDSRMKCRLFEVGPKISQTYIYCMEMRKISNFSLFLMRRCIRFCTLARSQQ